DRFKEKLVEVPIVPEIWLKLAVDVTGPLQVTRNGHRYILTIVDIGSRYCIAIPMVNQESGTIAHHLIEVFARFGWPIAIQNDLGCNFESALLKKLWEMTGTKQVRC